MFQSLHFNFIQFPEGEKKKTVKFPLAVGQPLKRPDLKSDAEGKKEARKEPTSDVNPKYDHGNASQDKQKHKEKVSSGTLSTRKVAVHIFSSKWMFLNISQISQENACVEVSS